MTNSIARELILQKEYLHGQTVQTVYFGGGTPSLLTENEIKHLLHTIYSTFKVSVDAEITLEANPDDLNKEKLHSLKSAGINRLSIGVQSFHDKQLQYLNRAHNAGEALHCLDLARETGFEMINVDLIFGIPSGNHEIWLQDIKTLCKFRPEHISAYCLTIEPGTVFGHWLKNGKIRPENEDFIARQFELGMETFRHEGYEHYEISNYCLPGFYAKHNSNYWKNEKYLGVGPAAHSYNIISRQYNIAHNPKYMKAINQNTIPFKREILSTKEKVNDFILTSLRTKWGCDLEVLNIIHNYDLLKENHSFIEQILNRKLAFIQDKRMILTDSGKCMADQIISELFVV